MTSTRGEAERDQHRAKARLSAVGRVPDEKAYLYEIIQTIGSGPDLESILRGIVGLVTEATRCHACLIFFVHQDRLVLRCASTPYAHLAGKVSMAIGEGLGGWVVKTRRSAFIKENALQDPRVRYFPEFEEERYQSLVSVPIFARGGAVIGVVNLHAVAPHEFARSDLDLLEHTASLVAGAVENATLYEDATRKVALLTDISQLAHEIAAATSVDDLLPRVASRCRLLLDAQRCEIHLLDAAERLVLRASSPGRVSTHLVDPRRLFLDRLSPDAHAGPEETIRLAQALWGEADGERTVFAPLVAGDERLGVLAAVLGSQSDDARNVLSTIASHTAVAMKQLSLIEGLREESLVKDFFEALSRGEVEEELARLASRLACDLDAPRLVLHAAPWRSPDAPGGSARRGPRSDVAPPWGELAGRLESKLSALAPGALFDRREASVRALLPAGDPSDAMRAVRAAYSDLANDAVSPLSIGLSNPCLAAGFYRQAFEEARSAAEVGSLIRGKPGVFTYDDLGPYRYVLSTQVAVRDRYQEAIERLAGYDRKRRTQLVQTLESVLDHRGNIVATSGALLIHPNTLRQRLARIEWATGLRLEREDWLSLGIAVKLVKLRLMKSSVGRQGEEAADG